MNVCGNSPGLPRRQSTARRARANCSTGLGTGCEQSERILKPAARFFSITETRSGGRLDQSCQKARCFSRDRSFKAAIDPAVQL
jgi:hypothetical protein